MAPPCGVVREHRPPPAHPRSPALCLLSVLPSRLGRRAAEAHNVGRSSMWSRGEAEGLIVGSQYLEASLHIFVEIVSSAW